MCLKHSIIFRKLKEAIIRQKQKHEIFPDGYKVFPNASGIPYPDMEDIEVDGAGIRKLLQKTNPRNLERLRF